MATRRRKRRVKKKMLHITTSTSHHYIGVFDASASDDSGCIMNDVIVLYGLGSHIGALDQFLFEAEIDSADIDYRLGTVAFNWDHIVYKREVTVTFVT